MCPLPQLTSLGDQLTDIYQASGGAVVLFDWVQFLREDTLRFLKIDGWLELVSEEQETDEAAADPKTESSLPIPQSSNDSDSTIAEQTSKLMVRNEKGPPSVTEESESKPASNSTGLIEPSGQATSSFSTKTQDVPQKQNQDGDLRLTPSQKLMSQILINDAVQQQKRFDTTLFDCEVCFLSYLGSDCLQLLECSHIFCRACISEFFSVQIKEGNVQAVQCPHADCTATPTHTQVRYSKRFRLCCSLFFQ